MGRPRGRGRAPSGRAPRPGPDRALPLVDVRTGVRWNIWSQELEESRPPDAARIVVGYLPPGRSRLRSADWTRKVEREVDVPPGGTVEIRLD